MLTIIEKNFGDKKRHIANLYDKYDAVPVASENTTSLRFTFDYLMNIINSLRRLGKPIEDNVYLEKEFTRRFLNILSIGPLAKCENTWRP